MLLEINLLSYNNTDIFSLENCANSNVFLDTEKFLSQPEDWSLSFVTNL